MSDLIPPADPALGLAEDEVCETCGAALCWDDVESMWYCPNTWSHL